METKTMEDKMNGNDLVEHIEHCDYCQERQKQMEICESKMADSLERQMEICCIETELKDEDYGIYS